jgi:hypothetical protein
MLPQTEGQVTGEEPKMPRSLSIAIAVLTAGLGIYNFVGFGLMQQWVIAALAGMLPVYALIEWGLLRKDNPDAAHVADRMLGIALAASVILSIMTY